MCRFTLKKSAMVATSSALLHLDKHPPLRRCRAARFVLRAQTLTRKAQRRLSVSCCAFRCAYRIEPLAQQASGAAAHRWRSCAQEAFADAIERTRASVFGQDGELSRELRSLANIRHVTLAKGASC